MAHCSTYSPSAMKLQKPCTATRSWTCESWVDAVWAAHMKPPCTRPSPRGRARKRVCLQASGSQPCGSDETPAASPTSELASGAHVSATPYPATRAKATRGVAYYLRVLRVVGATDFKA